MVPPKWPVSMYEVVNITLSLWRQKRIYITFNSYLTAMPETTGFTLQVKRHSSLPTVRNQRHRNVAPECEGGGSGIWFGKKYSQQRNWNRNNNSGPLRTKWWNIPNGLRCQDSRGGANSTYVHLCSIRAVQLNFKKSRGLTEQGVNVVSLFLRLRQALRWI